MKKKLILSTLCFVLLLIMMLSTTLAWFTDTAVNVNTMVAGKVSIVQTVVDTQAVVVPTVEIDRTITVKNDGNLPCYARTLIAFEDKAVAGTYDIDPNTGLPIVGSEMTLVEYLNQSDVNIIIPGVTDNGNKIQYTRDGVTYTIGYYTYSKTTDGTVTNQLAANESYTCLNSITLDETAPSEWNEASGEQYQILVLSQAVQVAGFVAEEGETAADVAAKALTAAFGELDAGHVETWFNTALTTTP